MPFRRKGCAGEPMGEKERIRIKTLEMARQGHMTLKAAAQAMRVNYRQAKRPQRAYRERGDTGIVHGNSGRASNKRLPEGNTGSGD